MICRQGSVTSLLPECIEVHFSMSNRSLGSTVLLGLTTESRTHLNWSGLVSNEDTLTPTLPPLVPLSLTPVVSQKSEVTDPRSITVNDSFLNTRFTSGVKNTPV